MYSVWLYTNEGPVSGQATLGSRMISIRFMLSAPLFINPPSCFLPGGFDPAVFGLLLFWAQGVVHRLSLVFTL